MEIFDFFFPVAKHQLQISKLFIETDQNFLICHLESVKYKPDVLNTKQLSCVILFKVGFTRENRGLFCFAPFLCLHYESALHCLNNVKRQSLEMVDMVMPSFCKFQLMNIT